METPVLDEFANTHTHTDTFPIYCISPYLNIPSVCLHAVFITFLFTEKPETLVAFTTLKQAMRPENSLSMGRKEEVSVRNVKNKTTIRLFFLLINKQ